MLIKICEDESKLGHEHTRRAAVDVVREKGRGKAMAVSAGGALPYQGVGVVGGGRLLDGEMEEKGRQQLSNKQPTTCLYPIRMAGSTQRSWGG